MKNEMLGDLSSAQFLQEYWQKKPLLICNALPGFGDLLNKKKLIALSCEEEIESRLINFSQGKWQLKNGPFKKSNFIKPLGNWTLLVQGVNYFVPEAAALIKKFNFIPYARLDDLMVSFASDGGGVGPHFDSYDVFLLQGMGKRLWQISKQTERSFLENMPLRILKNFQPEQEWVLEPGDMLYLPPNYAHNGIAIGDCMTYSIGFRAPTYQELVREFLGYLQDHLEVEGIYSDPELTITKHPARISDEMLAKVATILKKIHFGKNEIENFLGNYLSEPKPNLFFDQPESPYTQKNFLLRAKKNGICLDLKSQMLFTDDKFFVNGELISSESINKPLLVNLADNREVVIPEQLDANTAKLLYAWYLEGYLGIKE